MSDAPYILYIWPSKWDLQSLDPTCLAAVMYLQLTIPGKFKVAPCTNPDKSPNGKHPFRVGPTIVLTMCIGQLPFLTHGHVAVSTFPSIVAFVASLAKSSGASGVIDLDASLTRLQKAERVALYAHVEACISDLVVSQSRFANVLLPIRLNVQSHMFYGNDTNFWGLTNPALASEMSIPQKYYVASRIREVYRPRLEAAGLWGLPAEEEQEDKKKKRDYTVTFSRAFERKKVSGQWGR
jgi:sorting and assembly machinery component 37